MSARRLCSVVGGGLLVFVVAETDIQEHRYDTRSHDTIVQQEGSMRLNSPSASRNADVIQKVLVEELGDSGLVVEIASGTGQHAAQFCRAMPGVHWQASDRDAEALTSISVWRSESGLDNFLAPVVLDVCAPTWPVDSAHAIFCANMIHISPWKTTLGLFAGAARLLSADCPVILYGPYLEDTVETAPGNLSFERWLVERDSSWGIRRLEDVRDVADKEGFDLRKRIEMPANNLSLVFRKR